MKLDCSVDGFCELLHEVSSACSRKEAEALARAGLAVAEFNLLHEVATHPMPPLERLAKRLSISRSRLTRVMDALERKGLVERARADDDRRSVILRMTDKGRMAYDRAGRRRREAGGSLLSEIPKSRRKELIESLEMLRDRMMGPARPGGSDSERCSESSRRRSRKEPAHTRAAGRREKE